MIHLNADIILNEVPDTMAGDVRVPEGVAGKPFFITFPVRL
jgi:hypothetical protein